VKPPNLSDQVLDMLTLAGPADSETLAEALGASLRQISMACSRLMGQGYIHRPAALARRGPLIANSRYKRCAIWAIGPKPDFPPPVIQRFRPFDGEKGITADDLAWMNHWRQRAQQRQQQRQVMGSTTPP